MAGNERAHAHKSDSTNAAKAKAPNKLDAAQSSLTGNQQLIMQIQRQSGNQAAMRFIQRRKASISAQAVELQATPATAFVMTPQQVQVSLTSGVGQTLPGPVMINQLTVPHGSLKTILPADVEDAPG